MRLLLADDQPHVRFALRALLERQAGIQVVGEAGNWEALLSQSSATCPDAVLLDWGLPGATEAGPLSDLREACPETVVIVLSGRPEARPAALNAGADAFVSKTDPPQQLLAVLRSLELHQGKDDIPCHSERSEACPERSRRESPPSLSKSD
jgi:DNA-binding NarL/FixJ family response regulator